tara:strand:- start:413 stop:1027 length:615 start_codon:yes stop_codon:yes gene_type:complete
MLKKNEYSSKYIIILFWVLISFITPLVCPSSLHYAYPIALPISIASAFSIISLKNWNKYLYYSTISLFIYMMISSSYIRYKLKFNVPDKNRIIASELSGLLNDTDLLHIDILAYHHIIYYLVGKKPLTPYYHPPILIENHKRFQIDRENEYQNIFINKPKYVLVESEPSSEIIKGYLKKDYSIEKTLYNNYNIYKINDDINIQF